MDQSRILDSSGERNEFLTITTPIETEDDGPQDESQDVPHDFPVLGIRCCCNRLQTLLMDCLMEFTYVHKLQADLAEDYCARLGGIIVDAIDETAQELTDEQAATYRDIAKQLLLDSFGNVANVVFRNILSNH